LEEKEERRTAFIWAEELVQLTLLLEEKKAITIEGTLCRPCQENISVIFVYGGWLDVVRRGGRRE
jgi:hypothetical protein